MSIEKGSEKEVKLTAALTMILVVAAFYSSFSFEQGHWFREGFWVVFELSLIVLGVVYRNLLVAVPFVAHLYWVGMTSIFGTEYIVWKDGFWMVDVPITFACALNAFSKYSFLGMRTQLRQVEKSDTS